MALPREAREVSKFKDLPQGLGENGPIVIQGVSERPPKPSAFPTERPDLVVDSGDLPATARELRDLLASGGNFFDRGVPVKVVVSAEDGAPKAMQLTVHRLVVEAHSMCRPVRPSGDDLVPVTLPRRVAQMYLEMDMP
jgi:hypothetical protein